MQSDASGCDEDDGGGELRVRRIFLTFVRTMSLELTCACTADTQASRASKATQAQRRGEGDIGALGRWVRCSASGRMRGLEREQSDEGTVRRAQEQWDESTVVFGQSGGTQALRECDVIAQRWVLLRPHRRSSLLRSRARLVESTLGPERCRGYRRFSCTPSDDEYESPEHCRCTADRTAGRPRSRGAFEGAAQQREGAEAHTQLPWLCHRLLHRAAPPAHSAPLAVLSSGAQSRGTEQ